MYSCFGHLISPCTERFYYTVNSWWIKTLSPRVAWTICYPALVCNPYACKVQKRSVNSLLGATDEEKIKWNHLRRRQLCFECIILTSVPRYCMCRFDFPRHTYIRKRAYCKHGHGTVYWLLKNMYSFISVSRPHSIFLWFWRILNLVNQKYYLNPNPVRFQTMQKTV